MTNTERWIRGVILSGIAAAAEDAGVRRGTANRLVEEVFSALLDARARTVLLSLISEYEMARAGVTLPEAER